MGINLKISRIKAGIKQTDLAKIVHVSPATLIKWEKGINIDNIRLCQMKRIAEALDTTVQALFFDEE